MYRAAQDPLAIHLYQDCWAGGAVYNKIDFLD